MPIDRENHLQLYHTLGSSAATDVYVRELDESAVRLPSACLSIKGPYCEPVQMLPARFRFRPIAPGLWGTTIVDPCYWTPLLPACYRLEWEDVVGRPTGSFQEVALRRLHAQGKHLMLDGRRWVFRGTSAVAVSADQVTAYHESLLGLVVGTLDPALAHAASRRGVPLMVRLGEDNWAGRLQQAARWPAVQLALLSATWRGTREQLADAAPNVVRVAEVATDDSGTIPDWADAVLCPADPVRLASMFAGSAPRPVLVHRPGALQWKDSHTPDAARARRACERLQQELGAKFDASGYVV
jgi:hypothetical protein